MNFDSDEERFMALTSVILSDTRPLRVDLEIKHAWLIISAMQNDLATPASLAPDERRPPPYRPPF